MDDNLKTQIDGLIALVILLLIIGMVIVGAIKAFSVILSQI